MARNRNMHPKELTHRQKLLKELDSKSQATPQEEFNAIISKWSKVNDGISFKQKFYSILNE